MVEEAVDRTLEYDERLIAAVKKDVFLPAVASSWSTMTSSNASKRYCAHDPGAVDGERR